MFPHDFSVKSTRLQRDPPHSPPPKKKKKKRKKKKRFSRATPRAQNQAYITAGPQNGPVTSQETTTLSNSSADSQQSLEMLTRKSMTPTVKLLEDSNVLGRATD